MKKYIMLLPLLGFLCACSSKPYYQICKVDSYLTTSPYGAYEYRDASCNITYDFWANGGAVKFTFTNNTDEILYIDLSKSFVIKNGIAYDYFQNRSITNTATISASKSSGAAATANGFWNLPGSLFPGSITSTTGATAGVQSTASVMYVEQPVLAIPPHASKVISEYGIMDQRYVDCDLYESPSPREDASMSFYLTNTPMSLKNYICYNIGDNAEEHIVENSFFISKVKNQNYKDTVRKFLSGCSNDKDRKMEERFITTSPTEFYIIYQPRGQKKFSKSESRVSPMFNDGIYGN